MLSEKDKLCLRCELPICIFDIDNGEPKECAYTQITPRYYTDIYYPAFRQKEIAWIREWQKANKDKLAAAQKKYQQANREKINARRRAARQYERQNRTDC